MANSGEMNVNLSAAKAALETLSQAKGKLETAKSTMDGNPFQALCNNPDLASTLIAEIKASMEDMTKYSTNAYDSLNLYLSKIEEDPPIPDPPPPNGNGNNNGNGGNPTDPNITTPVTPPNGNQINDNIATEMSKLSLNDLDGVVDSLKDMSTKKGKGIDEILLDEKLAEELKALLLASQYIPDELKELLTSSDSQVVRQTFSDIMNGKYPEVFDLNPLNVGITYRYLCQIAESKGITIEELLADAEMLKEAVSGFGDAVDVIKTWSELPAEECQQELLKIYDGNEIADKKPAAIQIVRTFVDYVSEATEINQEELLTDTNYAEILKTAAEEFGKTSVLVDATASYSDNGVKEVIGNLFNGKNAGALGMTKDEVKAFKTEIDTLAQSKGVTADKLLSDSQYADDVKDALGKSENAKEIGTIFAQRESTVSQNVVKNLYNTEIKEETADSNATTDSSTTTGSSTTTESTTTSS